MIVIHSDVMPLPLLNAIGQQQIKLALVTTIYMHNDHTSSTICMHVHVHQTSVEEE